MDELLLQVHALLGRTRATLDAAGARDEALGEYVEPRPVLGIRRDPTMRDLGRVWRLGVLLLHRDGTLWATGSITRVTEPGRPQYQSNSAEIRRAYRAAANKGRFRTGETVNHGAVLIPLDETLTDSTGASSTGGGTGGAASGAAAVWPVFVRDGIALVRWSRTAGDDAAVPLADYLAERVELLVHPPQGA